MLWRIFELSFSVFQRLVKYACIDSVAIEKVQPEWRADTGEPCLRNLGSSLVSCSFWSVTTVLVTFAIWFVTIADFMVSGPFWSLVPALSMVYSSNFFPVAEFPPLFSSRSSKLDLLSLAADENQMWVLTVAVWSAWAPSFKCPGSRRSVCYWWSFQVQRKTCNQGSPLLLNRAGKLWRILLCFRVLLLWDLYPASSVSLSLCVLSYLHRLLGGCQKCIG